MRLTTIAFFLTELLLVLVYLSEAKPKAQSVKLEVNINYKPEKSGEANDIEPWYPSSQRGKDNTKKVEIAGNQQKVEEVQGRSNKRAGNRQQDPYINNIDCDR